MSAVCHGAGRPVGVPVTVTDTADEVVVAPALSVARAVNEYVPADTFVCVNEYGAVLSVPINVPPLKKSTLLIVPSLSEALALMVMDAGSVKVVPWVGEVMLTKGTTL